MPTRFVCAVHCIASVHCNACMAWLIWFGRVLCPFGVWVLYSVQRTVRCARWLRVLFARLLRPCPRGSRSTTLCPVCVCSSVMNLKLCFCNKSETVLHLFSECVAAKYVWGIVGNVTGASCRPNNFAQYFWWITNFLNADFNVQVIGLAAICWSLWKLRNKACFENKLIRSISC